MAKPSLSESYMAFVTPKVFSRLQRLQISNLKHNSGLVVSINLREQNSFLFFYRS